MAYTVEDFYKEFTLKHLDWLTPEERLKDITLEDVLKSFAPEDILKLFPPEVLEDYLKKIRQKEN